MDSTSWENIKSKYKLGHFVLEKVEFHTPFGVFVNINESLVKGLIKIPDFLDQGGMSPEMYPEIGTTIGAVVVGYNDSDRREMYLSANLVYCIKPLYPSRFLV
ncbi:RNA-binding protein [Cronbergia sp. UHCC 0137]|uniref:RNA-binding protein n=1 Tax=Cronbergia sp. UHCC 0137 TaxID=3110239 RepID=UPI002B210CF0|nr:RNA-binding protein [Cronbergia sp. UHCC 0137]MEA5616806.1 RNA-binding protein [Cronbergia sp. UHCC 0137]